ncbi:MAG TPA: hypothetical protein VEW91_11890 [bacterium]|nr:hypothetical protein [bacterium]
MYDNVKGGATLEAPASSYAFEIGASGDPSVVPITNPVTVTLTVGNNRGSATVTANII